MTHPNWGQLDNNECYDCGSQWVVLDCQVGHDDCINVECSKCDAWESTCYGGE